MNASPVDFLPLLLAAIIAAPMIGEGVLIAAFRREITPLPMRILARLGVWVLGKEQAGQRFARRTTPAGLRSYAAIALVSGAAILIAGLVNLMAGLAR